MLYSSFPLPIHLTPGSVYMPVLMLQSIPPSPFPTVPTCWFFTSASLLLTCKYIHLCHFSRFYIRINIQYLFSLFDLFQSVRQTLGPPTSLQMNQFSSFFMDDNIPLYICTISSLSVPLSMDIYVAPMSWLLYILLQ